MNVKIVGTVLKVARGVSKKTGKEYSFADVYDGDSLLKVFAIPPDVVQGELVEFDCRLNVDSDGHCYISCRS